jgi:hypothetical protein
MDPHRGACAERTTGVAKCRIRGENRIVQVVVGGDAEVACRQNLQIRSGRLRGRGGRGGGGDFSAAILAALWGGGRFATPPFRALLGGRGRHAGR